MKSEGTKIGIFWRLFDGFLIVVIFLLIGYSTVKEGKTSFKHPENAVERGKAEQIVPERMEEQEQPFKRANRVVNGIRVSNGFSAGRAVESMATDDWSGVRTAPAMDMRENGKSFEVVFTISGEMDTESIRSVTEGNVLKLSMKSKSGNKLT